MQGAELHPEVDHELAGTRSGGGSVAQVIAVAAAPAHQQQQHQQQQQPSPAVQHLTQAQLQAQLQAQAALAAQYESARRQAQAYAMSVAQQQQQQQLTYMGAASGGVNAGHAGRQVVLVAAPPAAPQEPGYLDTLWARKREITKLLILSLVILLAISGHATVWHFLHTFASSLPSKKYEVALRVAYPATVLIVLWHLKAFLVPGRSAGV